MATKDIKIADKPTLDTVKETTDDILALLEAEKDPYYGFIEHFNILDDTPGNGRIEYIGLNKDYTPASVNFTTHGVSWGSWADFKVVKNNKPWMVDSNTGAGVIQLNENDYTKAIDGSASPISDEATPYDACAWFDALFFNVEINGDDMIVKIKTSPAPGYEPIGFVDESGNVLNGVWVDMFDGKLIDSKHRSLYVDQLAADMTSTQTAAEKTYIDNSGARARFLGGPFVFYYSSLIKLLFKRCNGQEALGYGNCLGYVADAARYYGKKAMNSNPAILTSGAFYGSNDKKTVNKAFHTCVLPTNNTWKRDPYTLLVNGTLYVSDNYVYDLGGAGYKVGPKYPATGGWYYPNKFHFIPGFGTIGKPPYNGSTALAEGDGLFVNVSGTRVALRFGHCDYDLVDGPESLNLRNDASRAYWDLAASRIVLPGAGYAP